MSFLFLLGLVLVAGQEDTKSENIWPQCEETQTCTSSFPYCPDCSLVDCFPKLLPRDCPQGSLYEENIVWGCCPACVKYLSGGENCNLDNEDLYELATEYNRELGCGGVNLRVKEEITGGVPVFHRFSCGPDSAQCNENCILLPATKVQCSHERKAYLDWYDTSDIHKCKENKWEPFCTARGKFEPVQAKGGWTVQATKKFCWSSDGERLDGQAPLEDDTMNCLCSRKHWELQQPPFSRTDVTLHCKSNGNYEELQCDEGLCWCVNPTDGTVKTSVVHEDLAQVLDCFNNATFGMTYLRRCESRVFGKAYSQKIFQHHGLNWQVPNDVTCDNDGGYGPISCDKDNTCRCVDKMNQQIKEFVAQPNEASQMNCKCARDSLDLTLETNLICTAKFGGYKPKQDGIKTINFCVDDDGFRTSFQYPKGCKIPECIEVGIDDMLETCDSSYCPDKPDETFQWS